MFRSAVLLCAIAGCVAPDDLQTSTVEEHLCGAYQCGANSPVMDTYGVQDLNLDGIPNGSGLMLGGWAQNGFAWTVHVENGRLFVTRLVNGATLTRAGTDLIGGEMLRMQRVTQRVFVIKVNGVAPARSWAQNVGDPIVYLESYRMDWAELVDGHIGDTHNLCTNPPSRESHEVLGMNVFNTLVFEGDRLNQQTKRDTAIDNRWFNIGCAGHAIAKLALTGHTQAAQNAGTFTTTLDQRTAALKMFSGDYCGDGYPFTVTGQELRWADNQNTMRFNGPGLPVLDATEMVLEARWTAAGPHCLHAPRVDVNPTPLAEATFNNLVPSIYQQVFDRCGTTTMPPDCTDLSLHLDGYHLTSATPIP